MRRCRVAAGSTAMSSAWETVGLKPSASRMAAVVRSPAGGAGGWGRSWDCTSALLMPRAYAANPMGSVGNGEPADAAAAPLVVPCCGS